KNNHNKRMVRNGKSVANSGELVLGSGGGENEIEAISGSTVTSKAVISGLNDAIAAFKEFYAGK
ncbi:MAG: FMN-binding protein, partial [Neofamilia sp.]